MFWNKQLADAGPPTKIEEWGGRTWMQKITASQRVKLPFTINLDVFAS